MEDEDKYEGLRLEGEVRWIWEDVDNPLEYGIDNIPIEFAYYVDYDFMIFVN